MRLIAGGFAGGFRWRALRLRAEHDSADSGQPLDAHLRTRGLQRQKGATCSMQTYVVLHVNDIRPRVQVRNERGFSSKACLFEPRRCSLTLDVELDSSSGKDEEIKDRRRTLKLMQCLSETGRDMKANSITSQRFLCAQVRQEAILRYAGAPDADPPGGTTYEDADRQGEVSCLSPPCICSILFSFHLPQPFSELFFSCFFSHFR